MVGAEQGQVSVACRQIGNNTVRAVITPAEKAAFLIVILLRANRLQP